MSATDITRAQDKLPKRQPSKGCLEQGWPNCRSAPPTIERVCLAQGLFLFAHVSGNTNPLMLPPLEDAPAVGGAAGTGRAVDVGRFADFRRARQSPSRPGHALSFADPRISRRVHVGDRLTVTVTCREKHEDPVAVFETTVIDAEGLCVCQGTAVVEVPVTASRRYCANCRR